tara:strand:- start:6558 stop:8024 length:1467 start_codon:yes stop_codon:yes gene_type:complete
MTTRVDNLEKRKEKFGSAREITEGVPRDGFVDATGEYSKRDYFYGNSINKAAKGEQINSLFAGGGDYEVSTEFQDQKPSEYPHNKVSETTSGHIWEIDDTPGGERILLKHRSGAGVELRSDGSVLFSAVNKKVEVTGGDHTVIVEGEGNLVYKGNLNVKVTGDYNLQVDGNINVTTAGNKKEEINGSHIKTVDGNQNYVVKGSRNAQVVGTNTDTILGNNNQLVKGSQKNLIEGSAQLFAADIKQTASGEWAVSSSIANLTGIDISIVGIKGTIGGQLVDHYGKMFGGPPTGLGNGGTTFYGTLLGKAQEAITADFANMAGYARRARTAKAETGSADGANGGSGFRGYYPTFQPFIPVPPTTVMPNAAIILPWLTKSDYAIRGVRVDTNIDDPNSLVSKILKTDDYDDLFNRDPTIHEIRSKLRTKSAFNNTKFTGNLVATGALSSEFANVVPKKSGRAEKKIPSLRFGNTVIGNNPAETLSKRFRPQ